MKEEVKQVVETIVTHPKAQIVATSWLAGVGASFHEWWLDIGSPLLDDATKIAGLILVCVLIRYHWQNTKKIMKENKPTEKED